MKVPLTIGEVARQAGVNVETVRYYQRRGLLKEPRKPLEGFRLYPPDTVSRISFIKRAQFLGFTLQEASELIALGESRACAATRELALRRRETIDAKLADLKRMRDALEKLIRLCGKGGSGKGCPMLESLSGPPAGEAESR